MPKLNPSAQCCLIRFFTGYFASWAVHFINICVKNQQMQQLFIQFINLLNPMVMWHTNRFKIQQLYALSTPYLCVLYLSENKQRLLPPYKINWSIFITKNKSVYSAARNGYLNTALCSSSLNG
jgi:hypothetical protein